MKTLEDVNKILKEYPMYHSYKPYWYWSRYVDEDILGVEYKWRNLYIKYKDRKEVFVAWDIQYCIDFILEKIEEKKAWGYHCLYSDPL